MVRSLAVWLDPLVGEGIGDAAVAAELLARGVVEGSYDPKSIYREEAESAPPKLDEPILVVPGGDRAVIQAAGERGDHRRGCQYRADAVQLGRQRRLARGPGRRGPERIAERHGLWTDVIEPERATELGMGMFMAVGRGQRQPAADDVMRSADEGQHDSLDRHLAIVGKGVCFDSGGISIKPSERMEEMKMDKTGACTVIAMMETVARLAPARRCSVSPQPSRTCPAHTRPGPATS